MTNDIKNLPVQELEYSRARQQLVDFLKADTTYKDYNFEGSGISTLLNILGYNTHIMGFYIKMLLNESYVDSASTREALLSHAKRVNYTPKGVTGAKAEIKLSVKVPRGQEPSTDSIMVPRGCTFSSSNSQQDTRVFIVTENTILKEKEITATDTTYSGNLLITEGNMREWKFAVDSSVVHQRFVVKDENADSTTFKVFIKKNQGSVDKIALKRSDESSELDGTSQVYYLTTNENGLFQLFFGGGVFGFQPEHGNVIIVEYISSGGERGNGARTFRYNSPGADTAQPSMIGNFSDVTVQTLATAIGGMQGETVDALRVNIPSSWRRQNRMVTAEDFRGVILEKHRNVESLNVWGGEDHYRRDYGKVFCSLKPFGALTLSETFKEKIRREIVHQYGIVGSDVVFVDPEYIDVSVTVHVNLDRSKTNKTAQDVASDITQRVEAYNRAKLNKFNSDLSDLDMLTDAKAKEPWLKSLFSSKQIRKGVRVLYGSSGLQVLNFSNALVPGIRSGIFDYGQFKCYIADDDGDLFIYQDNGQKIIKESIGKVDCDTGVIEFKFPTFARIEGYEGRSGMLEFTATPRTPDVHTRLNNIVRITDVNVRVE